MQPPVALTIAGSDSGGGAGIQADLKTFQSFGVFGTSAVTAITAQNTLGVHAVHALPPIIVEAQINAVVSDFDVAAAKTGMLATRELVELVAAMIGVSKLRPYVLDPVMVATSGDRLLDADAETAITTSLMPLCDLITPNLDEAGILAGMAVTDEASMREAAKRLVDGGAAAALIKGGHLPGARVIDVLFDGADFEVFTRERIDTIHTHGTGCTLSAAIAAGFARGDALRDAVDRALRFVHAAIATAPGLGHGHGPLNHFTSLPTMSAD